MKIGIVGNYGNNNQGDESILDGIITQLELVFPIERQDILVFTNNREQTEKMYHVRTAPLFIQRRSDPMKFISTLLHHRPIMKELDFLIIGGGGILMDLYRNNPFVYGMYGLLVKWTKIPAFVYGVGAGPITTRVGKFFIRLIGNAAKYVFVRDEASKQLLISIGVTTPIDVILDPAFYLERLKKQRSKGEALNIAVTAVPYYSSVYWPEENLEIYQSYVQGMADNLDDLMNEYPEANIQFISTRFPEDQTAAEDIHNQMENSSRTQIIDKNLNHRDILALLAEQDFVIGTRLHSVILALTAGMPVIAVAYHTKVKDVMASLDLSNYMVPIEELDRSSQLFVDIVSAWGPVLTDFERVVPDAKEKTLNGMDRIKQFLPES